MSINVGQLQTPHREQQENLLSEFQEFVRRVNDRSIPDDAFQKLASECKERLDACEDDSDSGERSNSSRSMTSSPRSHDAQVLSAASYQERHGPTHSREDATPLTLSEATSQSTVTSHFSQANAGEKEHFQGTRDLDNTSLGGFEAFDSEDEREHTPVEIMTAQAITLQRLHPIAIVGPYCINGVTGNTQSALYHDVSKQTQDQPGKKPRNGHLHWRTDIDADAYKENETTDRPGTNTSTSDPSMYDEIRRRRKAGDILGVSAPETTMSMPRFSWILPRKTDSTFLSDAHVLHLALLPPQCESPAKDTYHPTIVMSGLRDSTFLYDTDVLHISLWGETPSEAQERIDVSRNKTKTTCPDKRDSFFLWKRNGTPVEIPVSESCWEAASRLLCIQTEIATADEHDGVYADLQQLGMMIETELADWL